METSEQGGYFPEGCDSSGEDCVRCVRRTAEATRALTVTPTAEWAAAVFHRMYTHSACRQMEHTFVWACGAQIVQVAIAAA